MILLGSDLFLLVNNASRLLETQDTVLPYRASSQIAFNIQH
jgi:hypothetical protein